MATWGREFLHRAKGQRPGRSIAGGLEEQLGGLCGRSRVSERVVGGVVRESAENKTMWLFEKTLPFTSE